MKKNAYWFRLSAITLAGLSMSSAALAQQPEQAADEGAGSPDASEIVVTALKRSGTAQNTPTTILVATGESLQAANIVSVEQLTTVVPGVRIQNAPAGLVNPTMRGLGSSPSNNSFEQTIGLFVDGVFLGHPRDYSAALFDVERVELLKGTQSAVLGKATSVGAISLVTRKPDDRFGYNVSYTHEFELGDDMLEGAVNVPLSDAWAVRFAGQLNRLDGHMDNALTDRDEPAIRSEAARLSVRFNPSPGFSWILSGQYSHYKQIGQPFYAGVDLLGRLAQTAAIYGDTAFTVGVNDHSRATGRAGDRDLGVNTRGTRFTSTIDLDLGNEYQLTAVTGYSQYKDFQMVNLVGVANNPGLRSGGERDESMSQEIRIASPDRGMFSWLAGAYYYYDKWNFTDTFDVIRMAGTPVTGATRTFYRQRTETLSGFAQATLRPVDKVTVVGGIRYDHSQKTGSYVRDILRPGIFTAALYQPMAPTRLRRKEGFFDYSGSIQYEFAPRSMAYVSYATGSKGGGFQNDPTILVVAEFPDEQSKTLEVGTKIGFAPGSHLNLAYYNTKIDGYQLAFFTGTSFVVRSDFVRSQGAEAELVLTPLSGLTISGNVTYTDIKKTVPVAGAINTLPFAPKWSGVGKISYEQPVGNDLHLFGDAIVEFRSKEALNDSASFVIPSSPGYAKLNLRFGGRLDNSGIEVAAIVKNVFDKRVVNYAIPTFLQTGGALVATDRPRTIGVQLTIKN